MNYVPVVSIVFLWLSTAAVGRSLQETPTIVEYKNFASPSCNGPSIPAYDVNWTIGKCYPKPTATSYFRYSCAEGNTADKKNYGDSKGEAKVATMPGQCWTYTEYGQSYCEVIMYLQMYVMDVCQCQFLVPPLKGSPDSAGKTLSPNTDECPSGMARAIFKDNAKNASQWELLHECNKDCSVCKSIKKGQYGCMGPVNMTGYAKVPCDFVTEAEFSTQAECEAGKEAMSRQISPANICSGSQEFQCI